MRPIIRRLLALLLALVLLCIPALSAQAGFWEDLFSAPDGAQAVLTPDGTLWDDEDAPEPDALSPPQTEEDGVYTAKEDVALYLMLYGHLPSNFITKSDAQALGWDSRQGNLWDVAPGMSIGGDVFGNREGLLPKAKGRTYYECDIDYEGGYRGSKRIVYSNDGLMYYTEDHYQTFECLSE